MDATVGDPQAAAHVGVLDAQVRREPFQIARETETNPHLIHYGTYETTSLKRMCDRHGRPPAGSQVATAVDHATNFLSFIYAQIYFPTYSNGLKEITRYLGFRWSGSLTSGLGTIVWRHRWEASRLCQLQERGAAH